MPNEIKFSDSKIVLDLETLETAYEGYIETYYLNGVEPDEALLLKNGVEWVKRHSTSFDVAPAILEIGNGGTIHHS